LEKIFGSIYRRKYISLSFQFITLEELFAYILLQINGNSFCENRENLAIWTMNGLDEQQNIFTS
jgi:hypothetical protein